MCKFPRTLSCLVLRGWHRRCQELYSFMLQGESMEERVEGAIGLLPCYRPVSPFKASVLEQASNCGLLG